LRLSDIRQVRDDDVKRSRQRPGQIALQQDRASRTVRTVLVTYSDGSTDSFSAYCTGAVKSGGVDSKVAISFTLSITGEITSDYLESAS